jgi:hypothetical protein
MRMGTEGYASIPKLTSATERIKLEITMEGRAKRDPNTCSSVVGRYKDTVRNHVKATQ